MIDMTKGDIVYYARIHAEVNTYDLCELRVRTIYENSFVGVDKHDKRAHLINFSEIGSTVFYSRAEALSVVKEAQSRRKTINEPTEWYYEEY